MQFNPVRDQTFVVFFFCELFLWPEFMLMDRSLPLAGNSEYAYSVSKSGMGSGRVDIKTRKIFPETWLWTIANVSSNGKIAIPLTGPDTITSWVATVFSVHPNSGLSVAAAPGEVTTFRNMFISLDLPSSIVRNEDFCFPVSVFSYYPEDIPVFLTLDPSNDFSNIYVKKVKEKEVMKEKLYYTHFMGNMKENEIQSVTFCITPEKIGSIMIRFSATTFADGPSDAVERKLPVKAEGVPRATTLPYLVELTNGKWSKEVEMKFPSNVVKGSEKVSVSIAGNLLGPIFDNLEDLLKKPYGCGEQNMINFSPLMSLLDFFYTTNTITKEIKEKAVDYMLTGYQKAILYEHGKTGGYSTFGNQETKENASMWLTAFVTKCFSQAELLDMKYKNILSIDKNLIGRSITWMQSQQTRTGAFVENGRVFNKQLQGGSGKGISLTAYVAIALHHSLNVFKSSEAEVQDIMSDAKINQITGSLLMAMRFLELNIDDLEDPYEICITAYALNLLDSRWKDIIFSKMESIAQKGFGMTYWKRPEQENKPIYYWSRRNDAISIEMTAYALLTYSLRGVGTTSGLPVVRWLSKQRGEDGGFISTQDTVIGLEALTGVSKKLYGSEFVDMTISVSTTGQNTTAETFLISKSNEMILQRKDIPYQTGGNIQINAEASGNMQSSQSTVLVDVVFKYNVESETKISKYNMSYVIKEGKDSYVMVVELKTNNGKNASMTILEVQIPAGYSPDFEAIHANNSHISKAEVNNGYLVIYIQTDVVNPVGSEFHIFMIRTGGTLTKSQGKSIKVYDYYDTGTELTKIIYFKSDEFCSQMPEFGMCAI